MPGSNHYREDELAKCPFYKKDSKIEIKCEGICGTHVMHIFRNKSDKESYMYDFCRGLWEGCEYAIMLEARYDD